MTVPGPKGLPFIGLAHKFVSDPFSYAQGLRRYGDLVAVPFAGRTLHYVFDPELVAQVLVHQHRHFTKGRLAARSRIVFGNGLVISEGETWRRQRALMAPAFRPDAVRAYGQVLAATTAQWLGGWQRGEVRSLSDDMMALTLELALQVLFGTTGGEDTQRVGRAFTVMSDFFTRSSEVLVPLPLWLPLPAHRRFVAARAELEGVVTRIIDERRADPTPRQDLLGRLLAATDEAGQGMSDAQLRDEVRTLLLAGHETTAIALTTAAWLLAGHPAVQDAAIAEARALPDDPGPDDDLPLLDRVIREALRLYPPVPAVFRESSAPVSLGGHELPAGTTFILAPWVIHRDPRHFDAPDAFRPDRWTPDFERALPRFAFLPFGGGPRVCIGATLSLLEARLVLGALLRRFRLARVDGDALDVVPSITLRPRTPVRLRLE